MGNWCVNENPSGDGYREFEMSFQEHYETLARRFVRVWDDGRIEVGIRDSPFAPKWSEQVLADMTEINRNLQRMREIMKGI